MGERENGVFTESISYWWAGPAEAAESRPRQDFKAIRRGEAGFEKELGERLECLFRKQQGLSDKLG